MVHDECWAVTAASGFLMKPDLPVSLAAVVAGFTLDEAATALAHRRTRHYDEGLAGRVGAAWPSVRRWGVAIVAIGHADSIDGVLERMHAIDLTLPADDGVAVFNRMYRKVTELVDSAVDASAFQAGDFLARLDVHFANLFFDAVVADQRGQPIAPAWAPLFEHRFRPRTHPIQFALAGMNAHISHDLPHAVVTTCRERGLVPEDDTPHHADFTATNDVLEHASGEIKSWFATGIVGAWDDLGGRVDDALEMWGISVARAAAWMVSQTLWELQDNPRALSMFRGTHARAVEMASRGILV